MREMFELVWNVKFHQKIFYKNVLDILYSDWSCRMPLKWCQLIWKTKCNLANYASLLIVLFNIQFKFTVSKDGMFRISFFNHSTIGGCGERSAADMF